VTGNLTTTLTTTRSGSPGFAAMRGGFEGAPWNSCEPSRTLANRRAPNTGSGNSGPARGRARLIFEFAEGLGGPSGGQLDDYFDDYAGLIADRSGHSALLRARVRVAGEEAR
jgi:hypothetical protein